MDKHFIENIPYEKVKIPLEEIKNFLHIGKLLKNILVVKKIRRNDLIEQY